MSRPPTQGAFPPHAGCEEGEVAARFDLLFELACAFVAQIDLDELLPLVAEKCRDVLDAEGVAVVLLDAERQELFFPYVAEDDSEVAARLKGVRFPADRGIAGAVLRSGTAVRVDDVPADPRFYGSVDRQTGATTKTMLAAPLVSRQGPIGAIQVINRRGGGPFSDGDLAFLSVLAGSIAIAIDNARLYARLKESEEKLRAEVGALRRDIARRDRFAEIVGTSEAMTPVFRLMDSAAASPISVLIEGETGTGKELVARGIHRAGERAGGPFLAVNCAALPETLLESELFGHRRGAFTGATEDRRGLFEAAARGTIFLDEVGEMPPSMQAKLLRVLQESEVIPVGETRPRKVDVRVISATNRDLSQAVKARAFREDLYYRLVAFPIRLPPLRERREDIPLLADVFLAHAAERHRKRIRGFEPPAMAVMTRYEWPGNVRQLQNEIERAVALAQDGEAISAAHLSPAVAGAAPEALAAPAPADSAEEGAPAPLRQARLDFETRYIAATLRRHGGNVSRAARALGISRVMLQKKMKEYGLRQAANAER